MENKEYVKIAKRQHRLNYTDGSSKLNRNILSALFYEKENLLKQ